MGLTLDVIDTAAAFRFSAAVSVQLAMRDLIRLALPKVLGSITSCFGSTVNGFVGKHYDKILKYATKAADKLFAPKGNDYTSSVEYVAIAVVSVIG